MRVEIAGKVFDSANYHTMRKFLQAMVNYVHKEVQDELRYI